MWRLWGEVCVWGGVVDGGTGTPYQLVITTLQGVHGGGLTNNSYSGAELTAEQQPISTAIGSALCSAVIGAELTAEQHPISTAIGSALCSAVIGAEL
ncbi:hypothetical protein B484DRAFT_446844, partial [Ochromonadaceae sp. CCMP2298]